MSYRLNAVLIATSLLIAGIVGAFVVVEVAANMDDRQEYMDRAEQWCDAEGGELYVSNSVGASGGLHCQYIGDHIHMADVAALNWTHDRAAIQQHYDESTGPVGMFSKTSWYGLGAIMGVTLVVGVVQRSWS